ncbi:hypothetical protein DICSQDRAFT_171703 [Dichomitus squalens LYAD-421 SS1]|uniref:Uncharacterized protein n=1 Tax=Dichomitus squalens (strain LYAD-421) TaxID=732165 RepID=R7SUL8_DICSQ|nr:uncharacterized protein DICSQDRAFT_171703 [Dichomitus squalens LYAD-421 SS1]EJF59736.1 hypothetical protein DICSQDRAFT_171703 [Dichomitus squalens LYAD-421 SS1]
MKIWPWARYEAYDVLPQAGHLSPASEPLPEATVSLRLIPQWSFRHIYPASQPKPQDGGGQSITWNVSASPDGWLVEKGSNFELSYLFWEAFAQREVNATANSATDRERTRAVPSTLTPLTPRSLPARPPPCSSPSRISSRTQCAQEARIANDCTERLHHVLAACPVEAAVRRAALPPAKRVSYAQAAELEVVLALDIVTRAMMLFLGVAAAEGDRWAAARERVGEVNWAKLVVMDAETSLDADRFRVLE